MHNYHPAYAHRPSATAPSTLITEILYEVDRDLKGTQFELRALDPNDQVDWSTRPLRRYYLHWINKHKNGIQRTSVGLFEFYDNDRLIAHYSALFNGVDDVVEHGTYRDLQRFVRKAIFNVMSEKNLVAK